MAVSLADLFSYYHSRDPRHTIGGAARAVLRVNAFAAAFIAMSVVAVTHRALLPTGIHRSRGPHLRRLIGRVMTRAAGIRIVRLAGGPRNIGAMVVANHVSWLDAFVLAGELGARFVVAETWRDTPVLGTILRAGGNLFIDRTRLSDARNVGRRIASLITRGDRVLVFPEAGASRGATIRPFHAALLEPAVTAGIPVSSVVLRYETPDGWPPAGIVMGWPDWTPLVLHMFRTFHPPFIRAELSYDVRPVSGPDRKALARRLHAAMTHRFTPLAQLPPEETARIECPFARWHRPR